MSRVLLDCPVESAPVSLEIGNVFPCFNGVQSSTFVCSQLEIRDGCPVFEKPDIRLFKGEKPVYNMKTGF